MITRVVYRTDSVFRYEPFGIFLVFTIPIPKENSVSIFGILKLAGASYTRGVPPGGLQFVRGEQGKQQQLTKLGQSCDSNIDTEIPTKQCE